MEKIDTNVDLKLIGQRIKEARVKKGWSQEELAEIINVATPFISRVERGGTSINLRRLAQISVALDVPIEELITGVIKEDYRYLDKDFYDVLQKCSKDKQRLIYNIAKIVAGANFVP